MFHLVEIVRFYAGIGRTLERRRHFPTAAASVRLTRDRAYPARSPTRARERGRVVVFRATQSAAHARLDARDAASTEAAVMRPLEESEIQQVFEKLFKFVGKNLKNIVDRADQPHCFRLHKKVRRARVQPPRSPRVARFARSLRTGRRGRKPTPTRERGDRLSGGSGGARTFFSRARRSFPPVRAFRAFATAAQPDSIPRVSDSSDEEISALPNGFGR